MAVRNNNLEAVESQDFPVRSRHIGDSILASTLTRCVDHAAAKQALEGRLRAHFAGQDRHAAGPHEIYAPSKRLTQHSPWYTFLNPMA